MRRMRWTGLEVSHVPALPGERRWRRRADTRRASACRVSGLLWHWRTAGGLRPPLIEKSDWHMSGHDTATTAEATTQLETLAADLSERGFMTTIATAGQYPRLTVINKAASQLSDNIYVAPARDGSLWFWWSWAERIVAVADVAGAAHAIARVLRAVDAGR